MKIIDGYLMEQHKVADADRKTINIDFDGVVHNFSKGFLDGTIYDKPQEGTEESLKLLKDKGFNLILFTARINAEHDGKQNIIDWLTKYDLLKYFSLITDKKMPSILIIDDSAVRHTDWKTTMKKISKLGII